MKNSDFYCKGLILEWIHVVQAILREGRLVGLTPRASGSDPQSQDRKVTIEIMRSRRHRAWTWTTVQPVINTVLLVLIIN